MYVYDQLAFGPRRRQAGACKVQSVACLSNEAGWLAGSAMIRTSTHDSTRRQAVNQVVSSRAGGWLDKLTVLAPSGVATNENAQECRCAR